MRKIFNFKKIFSVLLLTIALVTSVIFVSGCSKDGGDSSNKDATKATYQVSKEEKDYLSKRFSELSKTNNEVVAYVYAPGTDLDEPVVQTNDNETYLDKTFEGGNVPYLGTVFMDKHKYIVIQTPERTYYYEAAFLTIVPETTSFYRLDFDNDDDFLKQLTNVKKDAKTKNDNVQLKGNDKYLVLSTCREEDETIRTNLYLRQIPDSEMNDFLAKHKDELKYVSTR